MVEVVQDVFQIDTGFFRPSCTAAYALQHAGELLLFDTGVASTCDTVSSALAEIGGDVRYIVVSHVHLDHAGGAGVLMERFPTAELVVHPRGARHMADPSVLESSSRQVYGDEVFDRLYGSPSPIPVERMTEAPDGFELDWNGRTLKFLDAPGHAKHHLVMWDSASRSVFAGDAFGLSYPGDRTLPFPTTSPTQFDPDAMRATIEKILALDPERVLVGHFGVVKNISDHAARVLEQMEACVRIAEAVPPGPDRAQRIEKDIAKLQSEPFREDYAFDFKLNAMGLGHWLITKDR